MVRRPAPADWPDYSCAVSNQSLPAGSPAAPLISVLIVTAGRPTELDACLASLQAQEAPPAHEVMVLGVGDPTIGPVVRARYPQATIGFIERVHPGAARNALIERARGELLLFLDDDVTASPTLLARTAELARLHPDVAVFGGPNLTPPASTRFQRVQGAVLSSIVASGPIRRRYGRHPATVADERWFTLCNLAVRRSAMLPFAVDLVCAEENAVLAAMSRSGSRMLYDPGLVAYHERRSTWRSFAAQMLKYGRGRGQLLARDPRTLRPAYLAPSALLVALVLVPLVGATVTQWAFGLPLLYLGAVVASGWKVARTVRPKGDWVLASALVLTVHGYYGWGVITGLLGPRSRRKTMAATWVTLDDSPPQTAAAVRPSTDAGART